MQWTEELDALLNQCVFECGYDFTAAASLLVSRARQLRLVSGDDRVVVTSDECQVRWMEVNPVVEEDEDDGGDHDEGHDDAFFRRSLHDDDFHFYRRQSDSASAASNEVAPEIADPVEICDAVDHCDEIRSGELPQSEAAEPPPLVEIPDRCPRLELSLSDAELDALLSSLPSMTQDHRGMEEADSKHGRPESGSSEMQWVLSFLSNPDEAAHHDAEAKNMLFETGDRSEDDNFQYFLQQLNHANLMSPEKPLASTSTAPEADGSDSRRDDLDTTSDEEDDSDKDWKEARKQIKTAGPSTLRTSKTSFTETDLRPPHTPGHKRRLNTASHNDEVLPPAAPLRLPLCTDGMVPTTHDCVDEDSDDNGLDALPRYEPPPSAIMPLRVPPRAIVRPVAPSSSKLLALSHEIGQQMRQNGEFQFPKRLFRDLDSDPSIELRHEQVPEDEP